MYLLTIYLSNVSFRHAIPEDLSISYVVPLRTIPSILFFLLIHSSNKLGKFNQTLIINSLLSITSPINYKLDLTLSSCDTNDDSDPASK